MRGAFVCSFPTGKFVRRLALSRSPVLGARIHPGDHPACGFLEQKRQYGMNKGGKSGKKQRHGEAQGKRHMLQIAFIDGVRVAQEGGFHDCNHG